MGCTLRGSDSKETGSQMMKLMEIKHGRLGARS